MIFQLLTINKKNPSQQIDEAINEGLTLYQTHSELGGHYPETSRAEFQQKFKFSLRLQEDNDDLSALKQVISIRKGEEAIRAFLDLAKNLRDKDVWMRHWGDKDELKRQWFYQASHAHFTVDALFDADNILTHCLELIQEAKKNAGPEHHTYTINLTNLEQQIEKERQQIAETLYYRIKIAFSHHSLEDCQPISYLTKQLNIRDNDEINRSDGVFPIAKAYAYIMTHGEPALKDLVGARMKLMGNIDVHVVQHHEQSYLVPESIKDFIPVKRTFWTRLIPGYTTRYQFIHNKTDLLFQLMEIDHPSKANINYWGRLLDLQQRLDDELIQTASKKSRWFFFFYKKTNLMLSEWTQLIASHQRAITRKQIDFLNTFNIDNFLRNEQLTVSEIEDRVLYLREQLFKVENRVNALLKPGEQARFLRTKEALLAKISDLNLNEKNAHVPTEVRSMLSCLASKNKQLTSDEFSVLESELEHYDKNKLLTENKVAFQSIIANMVLRIKSLPGMIKAKKSFNEMTCYLLQASKLLSNVLPGMDEDQREMYLQPLKQAMKQSFEHYPDYMKSLSRKKIASRTKDFELLHTAIFSIVSLDPSLKEEKKIYSQADGYLKDILAGRPLFSSADIDKESAQRSKKHHQNREQTRALLEHVEQRRRERAEAQESPQNS